MKIGIITQPLVNNYGGILQNFALQQILKDLGCEPVTLNAVHNPLKLSFPHLMASFLKRVLKRMFGKKQEYLNPIREDKELFTTRPSIRRFIDKYISYIDIEGNLNNHKDIICRFDGFVVGSDQVWRPLYSPNILNSFLDFATEESVKVAYAASFGTEEWEYSDRLQEKASVLLKKFDGISVRENSATILCKTHLGVNATHVLDPTMLLSRKDYEKLIPCNQKAMNKKGYIAVYILDKENSKAKAIERVASERNLSVKYIGECNSSDSEPIEEWLGNIRNSELVMTDSFHGTVFSILFNRPFITFCNTARGNSRMESLLADFGLSSNLVEADNVKNICWNIDWEKVNRKINERRMFSISFLKKSLYGE